MTTIAVTGAKPSALSTTYTTNSTPTIDQGSDRETQMKKAKKTITKVAKTTKKTASQKASNPKTKPLLTRVMIGAGSWGLWTGIVDVSPVAIAEILKTKATHVTACRNIRYWYGPTGGITSLAALGPNPQDARNRIGVPVDMLVTDIKNIYYLTPAAISNFDAVKP
jgi:hypothetical protein